MSLRATIAITLAACGSTQQTSSSSNSPAMLCCDLLARRDFQLSTKAPVVANVCDGSTTLWSGTAQPGTVLDVPIPKVDGGKQVVIQIHPGSEPHDCLDRVALAKVRPTRDPLEVKLGNGAAGSPVIVPCNGTGAGCTCPTCPEPEIPTTTAP